MVSRYRVLLALLATLLGAAALSAACSDSSGPSDTTIVLFIDSVPNPTNQLDVTISGTTDPGAAVTVAGPRDTLSDLASAEGTFSLTVLLLANAISEVTVVARDSSDNEIGDTLALAQDGEKPAAVFTSPLGGSATQSQSGFPIALDLADDTAFVEFASGVDPASFKIESSQPVGGVFRQNGTFSTVYPAGTNLAPLFAAVTQSGANWVVPDSAAFSPGVDQMLARIRDVAGNQSSPAVVSFNVTADPDRLIVVDAGGSAGSTGNPQVIGLANGDTIGGVQFDFTYSMPIISSVDSVTVAPRTSAFDEIAFNEIAPGQVRVLLFDSSGDLLPPGQGPIITLWLSVDAAAAPGDYTVVLEQIFLSDRLGVTRAIPGATGTFRVP